MSYCRWSSDGFQCDVYVYETCGGYAVHVARNRRPRRVCDLDVSSLEAFQRTHEQQLAELNAEDNEPVPIGGSCDGKSFSMPDVVDTYRLLCELRLRGYKVPEYALEALLAELDD